MAEPFVLYGTVAADRFFLLPVGVEPAVGDLRIASIDGAERRVDPASVAQYEVTRGQAAAHVGAEVERLISPVTSRLAEVIRVADKHPTDLNRVAEALGVTLPVDDADPGVGAGAGLRGLIADLQAILAATSSGQATDLDAARRRLRERGLDLGTTLDGLPPLLQALRGIDQPDVVNAIMKGTRAFVDSVEGDPERSAGQRIDDLVAKLERDLGPFIGRGPDRTNAERKQAYAREACSSIADALRAAGIAPLNDPDQDAPLP